MLATYMYDIASTFLGFECDAEASYLVLGKDLEMISIRTKADHGRLGKDGDMEWKHGTSCGATRKEVELDHKREGEATVTTLKTQVLNMESFTKTWSSLYGLPPTRLRR